MGIGIDGSWNILIGDVQENKLIPLSDYTGGEISSKGKEDLEAKKMAHIMSPMIKKASGLDTVAPGVGSKNPTYQGKRAMDMALGRAEE